MSLNKSGQQFLSYKQSSLFLIVSTGAVYCLERLVSEMTCYLLNWTLNPTHSLTLHLSYFTLP